MVWTVHCSPSDGWLVYRWIDASVYRKSTSKSGLRVSAGTMNIFCSDDQTCCGAFRRISFELSAAEWAALRSQSVTSKPGRGGRRYAPYAFTEQGVAMLSSVLNSDRAIAVNIEIMRSFVRIRRLLEADRSLARKFERFGRKLAFARLCAVMIQEMALQAKAGSSRKELHRVVDLYLETWPPCPAGSGRAGQVDSAGVDTRA